jgi:hypothetical protein
MAPSLDRREYPEVSYSVIGAIVTGLMGISGQAARNQVTTRARLTPSTDWIEVKDLSILSNRISVRHTGSNETSVNNQSGPEFLWKAYLVGEYKELVVNGLSQMAHVEEMPSGQLMTAVTCTVAPETRMTVTAGAS